MLAATQNAADTACWEIQRICFLPIFIDGQIYGIKRASNKFAATRRLSILPGSWLVAH